MTNAHPRGGMSCLRKYYFLALMAIEFLMSFTFLGYVHIEPISITIAYLPMLIAGCFLGVGPSAAMGLFFGLASMYKASANYVMPMDKLFSPFFSGAPVASLAISVGVRALFGWLVGLLFSLGRRARHPRLWAGIIAVLAPRLHSMLVYTAMGLLFPQLGYGPTNAFRVGVSDALLALLCLFVIEGLWSLQRHEKLRDFEAYLERRRKEGRGRDRPHWPWLLFLACILCAAVASTFLLCPADGLHAERLRHIACAGGGTRSAAFADTIAARHAVADVPAGHVHTDRLPLSGLPRVYRPARRRHRHHGTQDVQPLLRGSTVRPGRAGGGGRLVPLRGRGLLQVHQRYAGASGRRSGAQEDRANAEERVFRRWRRRQDGRRRVLPCS